jgi:hypothetical protein
VLPESTEVYSEWKRLVAEHKVQGVKVHDARIVAAMNVHGINRIVPSTPMISDAMPASR